MDVTKPYKFTRFEAMYVTKPYNFTGFGAMDVTKRYIFIRFGALDVTKPYKFIRLGGLDVTKPYKFVRFLGPWMSPNFIISQGLRTKLCKFIGFGAIDVTKPYKFIGFGAMLRRCGRLLRYRGLLLLHGWRRPSSLNALCDQDCSCSTDELYHTTNVIKALQPTAHNGTGTQAWTHIKRYTIIQR